MIDELLTNVEVDELKQKLEVRKDKFFIKGRRGLLIAIDHCIMNNDLNVQALVVGKAYRPSRVDKYGVFTIKSEIDQLHQFTKDSIR